MSDLDSTRAAREALRKTGEMLRPTRYSQAVDRYLGAAAYHDLQRPAHRPVRPTLPAPGRVGLVVVGVDDTPDSYVALDHAAIEAELYGWDLRMVHVQHGGGGPEDPARERGARLLENLTARVHARSRIVPVTSRIETGLPSTTLLAAAEGADLVVVGRRHGAAGAAFGLTVGDFVAAHHLGPVLVVRMPGWPPGPEFAQRPIIAGVDGSSATSPVVDFALAEARVRGCDLVLLHAADTGIPVDRMDAVGGVTVHHRTTGADPIAALVAASDKAAAIVVLRHGRPSLADTILGSVSRSVLQHAHCPVFLVG